MVFSAQQSIVKDTPLKHIHVQLGAKMINFAGFNMPVSYTGVVDEHLNVRQNVGIFDVSHMGEFMVTGSGAMQFIQNVTSNDVGKLSPGKAQYSCLPNENLGIVDDLLVYMVDDEHYMLVVNASNMEKDWNWLMQFKPEGVNMENVSDQTALLAVQGPKALNTIQKVTDFDLSTLAYYTFTQTTIAGVGDILISATGYTGSGGFEIYCPAEHAETMWKAIMEAGNEFGIMPTGLAARDTLRLEMGYCLYGNDIDDTTSPIEAGLGWITKLDTGFIGSEKIIAQKEAGIERKLCGFKMIDRGIPRKDYEIADTDGTIIGKVTSGTQAPSLDAAIGMGYVQKSLAKIGNEIHILVRNKTLRAEIVKLPFFQPN